MTPSSSPTPCPKRLAAPTGLCRGVTALAGLFSGSRAASPLTASEIFVPEMPPVFGAGNTDVLLCLGLREMSCGAGRRGVSRRLQVVMLESERAGGGVVLLAVLGGREQAI